MTVPTLRRLVAIRMILPFSKLFRLRLERYRPKHIRRILEKIRSLERPHPELNAERRPFLL